MVNFSQVQMVLTFTNRTMQSLSGFAIQFNKNSFGLAPKTSLNAPQLSPNQSHEVVLPLSLDGAVQKMEPLNNFYIDIAHIALDIFCFAVF